MRAPVPPQPPAPWRALYTSRAGEKKKAPGGPPGAFECLSLLRLLQDRDGSLGLLGREVGVACLARGLRFLHEGSGLGDACTRSLHVLTARSLHVLGTRRLDILGTRSLHVLTARGLDVLGTRRLDILGTRSLH